MPLTMAKAGETVTIQKITGKDEVRLHLAELGFVPTNLGALPLPAGMHGARQLLQDFLPRMAAYKEARDYPGRRGVSYLSVHLRFGTLSIRQVAALAARAI